MKVTTQSSVNESEDEGYYHPFEKDYYFPCNNGSEEITESDRSKILYRLKKKYALVGLYFFISALIFGIFGISVVPVSLYFTTLVVMFICGAASWLMCFNIMSFKHYPANRH